MAISDAIHSARRHEGVLVTAFLTLAFCVVLLWGLLSGPDPVLVWSSVVMIAIFGGMTARSLRQPRTKR